MIPFLIVVTESLDQTFCFLFRIKKSDDSTQFGSIFQVKEIEL